MEVSPHVFATIAIQYERRRRIAHVRNGSPSKGSMLLQLLLLLLPLNF
jgi:hypothetical protein